MTIKHRSSIKIVRLFLLLFIFGFTACFDDYHYRPFLTDKNEKALKTKNVVVVIMDGLRYTEGWGDSAKQYIPYMAKHLAPIGVLNTKFYNKGDTYTSAGHANITTGINKPLENGGNELPAYPSFFQYWLNASGQPAFKAWIIASKDKLAVLGNSNHPAWNNLFTPLVNAGNEGKGIGSGYRPDSLTLAASIEILKSHHPRLVLINFREPDFTAHSGNWAEYLKAIKATDKLVFQLWQFLKNDSFYSNTTALFVTSDHGRHSDTIADGFASHGDDCEGCRHLGFFAAGPDFKKGYVTAVNRQQPDITATISYLLGMKMEEIQGEIMIELFGKSRK
jgi:hypothetical protein